MIRGTCLLEYHRDPGKVRLLRALSTLLPQMTVVSHSRTPNILDLRFLTVLGRSVPDSLEHFCLITFLPCSMTSILMSEERINKDSFLWGFLPTCIYTELHLGSSLGILSRVGKESDGLENFLVRKKMAGLLGTFKNW